MDLHGLIERVGALGAELEHDIATDARRAWQFLQAELEKLRPHAHPSTGVISIDPDGKVVPPDAPTPTAAASNAAFAAAGAPASDAPLPQPAAEPEPTPEPEPVAEAEPLTEHAE